MKKIIQVFSASVLALTMLAACQEGPSEKKGKQIDNSIEKAQDKLLNKGPAQKTGEKIDELTH